MKSFPLPKSCLLTKPWQYNRVYREGKRRSGKGFTLVYLDNSGQGDRLGISISGVRLATRRNRLKRIIKEFYRQNRSFPSQAVGQKGMEQNFDVVIAARKQFSPESLSEFRELLLPLLQRDDHRLTSSR